MITTKRTELEVINSFNDLMKDSKEKQKINEMIKQYSNNYFMSKLADCELEDNKTSLDVFEELSSHYQKYAYIITRDIASKIKEENGYEEDYYDGTIDSNGFKIAKTRIVFDRRKFGENFGDNLEESLNDLVVSDYFKNLNKALESYNFNAKIKRMKEKEQQSSFKASIRDNLDKIDYYIKNEIKAAYSYYIRQGNDKEDIIYNFRYNSTVIDSMLYKIKSNIKNDLGLVVETKDIEGKLKRELNQFTKLKEKEEDDSDPKIPLGWKAYAITKFINKMFK